MAKRILATRFEVRSDTTNFRPNRVRFTRQCAMNMARRIRGQGGHAKVIEHIETPVEVWDSEEAYPRRFFR